MKGRTGGLSGNDWYQQQASRAVNQVLLSSGLATDDMCRPSVELSAIALTMVQFYSAIHGSRLVIPHNDLNDADSRGLRIKISYQNG